MARSAKLRAVNADEGEMLTVDLSPMIDMVFLLLIFFLVNATMIIVRQDKNVEPAVASESTLAEDGRGRIVVNVYADGTFTDENSEPLETELDIIEWVRTQREKVDLTGVDPKLHLRGHKDATFKHARKAIRAAAKAGVSQVIFAVYQVE